MSRCDVAEAIEEGLAVAMEELPVYSPASRDAVSTRASDSQ